MYKGDKDVYANAKVWRYFTIIDDIEFPTPTEIKIAEEVMNVEPYVWVDIPKYTINTPKECHVTMSCSNEEVVIIDPATNRFIGLQDGVAVITIKVNGFDVEGSFTVYVGNTTGVDKVAANKANRPAKYFDNATKRLVIKKGAQTFGIDGIAQ